MTCSDEDCGIDSGGKSSYAEGDQRARCMYSSKSSDNEDRDAHAPLRRSSHTSRVPRRSKFSALSRRRWMSLSNSKIVSRASSMRSVSWRERERWDTAAQNQAKLINTTNGLTCCDLLQLPEFAFLQDTGFFINTVVLLHPSRELFRCG
jgi:hypothetical protein